MYHYLNIRLFLNTDRSYREITLLTSLRHEKVIFCQLNSGRKAYVFQAITSS